MRAWQQLKNVYHYFQAHAWRAYFGWPDRSLKLYGVTGTNGKTTTSIVLGSILRAARGHGKVGLISTELFWFGDEEKENATHMTSVDARVVYSYLRRMVNKGVTDVVLEMTSHALDQRRLAGVQLAGAILLNIKHEHLDYHETMEEYAEAKRKIVDYLIPKAVVVANFDDNLVRTVLKSVKRVVWFTGEEAKTVDTLLPGDFNKENVLAASLLARQVGIGEEVIARGVSLVRGVPGRAEWIEASNGIRVMIDFALTPYAYERLFKYLRAETQGTLIAVFGAAGRRDKEKRPKISRIVSQYADEIVLTQDEPYDDSEEEIYSQLEAGLKDAMVPWQRIEDRREAIQYALGKAQAGDVVVVLGMGNFDFRMVGDEKIPWNDRKVVEELVDKKYPLEI